MSKPISEFSAAALVRSILASLREKGLVDKAAIAGEVESTLANELDHTFPEIGAIGTLRMQFHFSGYGDVPSFPKRGDRMEHLTTHYGEALKTGYLPISEIEDIAFRQSLIAAKAHGQFAEEWRAVCLTRSEMLDQRRAAFETILATKSADAPCVTAFLISYQLRNTQ